MSNPLEVLILAVLLGCIDSSVGLASSAGCKGCRNLARHMNTEPLSWNLLKVPPQPARLFDEGGMLERSAETFSCGGSCGMNWAVGASDACCEQPHESLPTGTCS